MGNAPSKEPPQIRPPYKLSKPRIVSHSTTVGLLNSNIVSNCPSPSPLHPGSDLIGFPYSATAIRRPSPDHEADGCNDSAKRISFLAPSKSQRRLSLFRSKSSRESSERSRSRRNTIIGSPAQPSDPETPCCAQSSTAPPPLFPNPPHVVRANSMNTYSLALGSLNSSQSASALARASASATGLCLSEDWPPPRYRASWVYDQPVSSFDQGQPPTPVAAIHQSHTSTSLFESGHGDIRTAAGRRGSLPQQDNDSAAAAINRSSSKWPPHPRMRRRSMIQTPGLATRTVCHSSILARSSSRHSLPLTPSPPRPASQEAEETCYLTLPSPSWTGAAEDIPRVVTPVEGEYGTTGAFKFGTLRITNGSPETTHEVETSQGAGHMLAPPPAAYRDYLTKTSPSAQEEEVLLTHATKASFGLSPIAVSAGQHRLDAETFQSAKVAAPHVDGNRSKSIVASVALPHPDSSIPINRSRTSPSLQTQSKHRAAEDRLFGAEDDSPLHLSTVEVLDVRVDINAKSLPPQQQLADDVRLQPCVRVIHPSGSSNGVVSNSASASSTFNSSLAKADSGYSSSASLRSYRSGKKPVLAEAAEKEEDCPTSTQDKRASNPSTRTSRQAVEPRKPNDRDSFVNEQVSTSPPTPKDIIYSPSAVQAPCTNRAGEHDDESTRWMRSAKTICWKLSRPHLPPITNNTKTEVLNSTSLKFSPPMPAGVKKPKATVSAAALSIGDIRQRPPGRLQRLLRMRRNSGFSSKAVPSTTDHNVTTNTCERVPSTPKEVDDRFREQTGPVPTSFGLRSEMSQETLQTILSVGSLELLRDDQFSSPPTRFDSDVQGIHEAHHHQPCGDGKERLLRQTINSMQTNFKEAAISMMPSKKIIIRRKPLPTRPGPQGQRCLVAQAATSDSIPAVAETRLTHHSYRPVKTSLAGRSQHVSAAKARTEDQLRLRHRPTRSMVNKASEPMSGPQLRRYSLNDMPSSYSSSPRPRSSTTRHSAFLPPRRVKTTPPVAMETYLRNPAPGSAPRPCGPAVVSFGDIMVEEACSLASGTFTALSTQALNHRRSVENLRHAACVSGFLDYRTANWDPDALQKTLDSRRNSLNRSRRNSLSSVHSDDVIYGPTRAQTLTLGRHPSLVQGQRNHSKGVYVPQAQHQVPNSTGRPVSVSDMDLDLWSSPQPLVGEGRQSSDQGRYPSHVSRGQADYRRHSTTGSALHQPYRILHSYNSPAYRNAPIWG